MVTDDDDAGQPAIATATIVISGVNVVGNTLYVVGTDLGDRVTINQTGNGKIKVTAGFLQGGPRNFSPAENINSISVISCGGDDHVNISSGVSVPTFVDGGDGNDHLNGGNAGSVLLGGAGDDMLIGGKKGDILIGGSGRDRLIGNAGEDVLIGGSSSDYESDPANQQLANDEALLALLADWNSSASRPARELALADLVQSIEDDEDKDTLTGSSGNDWFFTGLDDIITGN